MRAALVGPGQQENLALEYLAAAAQKSGHSPALIRFDSIADLQRCVEEIWRRKPDLVGVSIPFQYAIGDAIELARALRLHGYRGHLTCGGHVPTFCYRSLLADAPEIGGAGFCLPRARRADGLVAGRPLHLLGIENASAERLAYLGRRHTPAQSERALSLCKEERITPSFNLMIFDPDCAFDDIQTNLDFASRHLDLTWNVCRTEIYPGTRLFSRLQEEGRLLGDYRTLGYRMRDPIEPKPGTVLTVRKTRCFLA